MKSVSQNRKYNGDYRHSLSSFFGLPYNGILLVEISGETTKGTTMETIGTLESFVTAGLGCRG